MKHISEIMELGHTYKIMEFLKEAERTMPKMQVNTEKISDDEYIRLLFTYAPNMARYIKNQLNCSKGKR